VSGYLDTFPCSDIYQVMNYLHSVISQPLQKQLLPFVIGAFMIPMLYHADLMSTIIQLLDALNIAIAIDNSCSV
jgi:hypothetical protein